MFKFNHYVPILKWKRAEQKALKGLKDETKQYITPLIKLVMPKPSYFSSEWNKLTPEKQFEEIISKFRDQIPSIAKHILEFWGKTPMFIDFSLLYTNSLKVESLQKIMADGNEFGIFLIPVLNLSDDVEIIKSVCTASKQHKRGLCLRLVCSDLDDLANMPENILSFLSSNKLNEQNIDLLIDIQEIENSKKYQFYMKLCYIIPSLLKWRTFTFASGAFPVDLSKCKIDEENPIPRLDWNNWVNQIDNNVLKRIPSFSDYTIQYPIYKEAYQFYPPTTSIKYTLKDNWLILKGKKQEYGLYLANARLLSEDNRFFGEKFSSGDKYIFDKGKHFAFYQKNPKIKGTGGTEAWLTAGINHHMECTVKQIASLS